MSDLPGRHRTDPRDRLLATVRELAFARERDALTAVVRTAARELTGADGVTFVLREGDLCHYADEDAIAPLWKGRRFPLDECISGWVMRRGVPVAVGDVYADPRIPHDAYRPTFVRSLAMVPVRTPDPVAAIGAYWARLHTPTPEELWTLQTLAEAAALALSNVQLYRELNDALGRERIARCDAERATRAKDDFLAIVAHELRQPLSACAAAAALLRGGADRPVSARACDVIGRQITRMTRLVDDLLDASRIVRGDVVLRPARMDLREAVQQAVEIAAPLIAERRHELRVDLPPAACVVDGDAQRLEQVFANLLTNAAKYTPPGGDIAFVLRAGGGRITAVVRDNGDGIARDKVPHIFELFNRAAGPSEAGFGIGLAIARRLVEQHAGSLRVRSGGPGCGSEFTVELPAAGATDLADAARCG